MRRMDWGLSGGWGWGEDGDEGLWYMRGSFQVALHTGVGVERGMASKGAIPSDSACHRNRARPAARIEFGSQE